MLKFDFLILQRVSRPGRAGSTSGQGPAQTRRGECAEERGKNACERGEGQFPEGCGVIETPGGSIVQEPARDVHYDSQRHRTCGPTRVVWVEESHGTGGEHDAECRRYYRSRVRTLRKPGGEEHAHAAQGKTQ